MAYYIDNAALRLDLIEWQKQRQRAKRKKEPEPPIPEFTATCIVKIATRYSLKANFAGYPFRDELAGDAIESCVKYIHNFDPDKGFSALAYITQISHNAMVRRIQSEQKHHYIRARLVMEGHVLGVKQAKDDRVYQETSKMSPSKDTLQQSCLATIEHFENWKAAKSAKSKAKKVPEPTAPKKRKK